MKINISTNVTAAMALGNLTTKQIGMLGTAHAAFEEWLPLRHSADEYQIQFDNDRTLSIASQSKAPCRASLYVKNLSDNKVFESRQKNPTSQLGLDKFIHANITCWL
jgi:hypothetical protein|tara:strand:- start:14209 stop:14529 length:321 start_codon:yes stop_codon:yes gene_type:complete